MPKQDTVRGIGFVFVVFLVADDLYFFCVDDADRDDDAATACNGGVTVLLRFFFYSPDVLSEHFCGPLSKRDDPRAHAKIIYS